MRILIIQNPAETIKDYAAYISTLITDYATWLGYEIIHTNSFKNIKDKKDNCIFVLTYLHSWDFLFDKKLALVFKKSGIDVMINLIKTSRLKNNPPRIVAIDDEIYSKTNRKFLSATKKAKFNNEITFITYAKSEKEKFKLFATGNEVDVQLVPFTASGEFKTFEWPDKVLIKAQYSGNKEYFLCLGQENEAQLLEVLKGFSKFKKWQQSSMQLILVVDESGWLDNFIEKLKSYRYTNDVQIIRDINLSQLACLFAAAYSFIHATNIPENIEPLVSAMQCSIPAICTDIPVFREYAGDAALYMPVFEAAEISKHMIGVYKNEIYKTRMEKSALEASQQYKRDDVSKKLWQLLEPLAVKS